MSTEPDLIKKIQLLKQIRPRQDWVLLTKKELFKEEIPSLEIPLKQRTGIFPRIFLNYRFAIATLVMVGVLSTGAVNLAQTSLPGDTLYPVKRITEKSRAVFVSESEKPKAQLALANKRLDELTKIAETNQDQKITPAIIELQASLVQAAEGLKKPSKLTKEIVEETQKLEEKKGKIEALGVVVEDNEEFTNTLKDIVEKELVSLENTVLRIEDWEVLWQARQYFESGEYTKALEQVWLISQ
ncbi:DUF5667 domain-containing protein [Patescibacteria group bacterium]